MLNLVCILGSKLFMLLLGFILVTIRNILGVHFGDIFILEAGSRTLGFVLGDNLGIYLGDTLGAY